MFTLPRFVANNGTGAPGSVQMTTPEGGIDRMSFNPHLMRPYRERSFRVVNGRRVHHGPERVWVNVLQGTETVHDKTTGMTVYNEDGTPQEREVYEPQLVYDRKRRDLPVINVVSNATVLRKDQWLQMDRKLLGIARKRLRAWADLRRANTFGGIDGMSTPILEFERLVDAGEAVVSMSPKTRGNNAAPKFELDGIPLPITHSDFDLDARFLAVSRARGGPSAETTRGELAARRVAEAIEMTYIGSLAGLQYGDATDWVSSTSKVYGLTNHPDRITKTDLVAASGITGANFLQNVLDLIVLAEAQNFFGPYQLYVSTSYDQESRNDFKADSDKTIRERVLDLAEIKDMKRLDYLSGDVMILVQEGESIDAINGMEVITVQRNTTDWEELSFKVMGIQVPRIRAQNVNNDLDGGPVGAQTAKAPVIHGTTS